MRYKTTNDFCHFLEKIDHEDRIKNKWTEKDIEYKITKSSNKNRPLQPMNTMINSSFNNKSFRNSFIQKNS